MNENDAQAATRFRRAVRAVAYRRPGKRTPSARGRDLRRVLLIAPPCGCGSPGSGDRVPPGLAAQAESLRAAGFQVEVYDAMSCSVGASSIRAHIEHAYPQVVAVAACDGTTESFRDVLSAAKEVVPSVLTVLFGSPSASVAGTSEHGWVDCVVDADDAETLPGLLARLTRGEQPKASHGIRMTAS